MLKIVEMINIKIIVFKIEGINVILVNEGF